MRGLTERPLNLENREKRRSSGLHRALAKQDCRDELVENAVKKKGLCLTGEHHACLQKLR